MKIRYFVWLIVGIFMLAGTGRTQPVAPVKSVIWVIGDGMGPEIMGFFMEGVRYASLTGYSQKVSSLERLMQRGVQGLYFNNTYNTIVTDSTASATQMASGKYTLPEYAGLDYEGHKVTSILELAKEKGKSTGIVTDAYVTDATPAGFTAHVNSRRLKKEIAQQQIDLGLDVISGGGLKYFDQDLREQAKKKGYTLATTSRELSNVKKGKLLGLFAETGMPFAIEMNQHPNVPSLAKQTEKALALLDQNPEGFVLMVEAGKIDWAAHANDPGSVLAEMKALDAALAVVLTYAEKHPDTLIYVSADHDTGLGTFVYQYLNQQKAAQKTSEGEVIYNGNTLYHSMNLYNQLDRQTRSLQKLERELRAQPYSMLTQDYLERRLGETLGTQISLAEFTNLQDIPGVFRQLNEKRGFGWATATHSSAPLIGVAYGPHAELFSGVYHNTDIFPRMKKALGWE